MKLNCILTSCNNNPLYMDFIPIFVRTWKKLYPTVDVKIILINSTIPDKYKSYKKNIILFPEIPNVDTAFTSQYIRLLYPAILLHTGGILITDIDMLPMNNTYFSKNIKKYNDDKFIYLRDVLVNTDKQIAVCYNVATPKTWSSIFNINSIEDIKLRLVERYKTIVDGWFTDQADLYTKVNEWNNITNGFIILKDKDTKFKRLDRGDMSSGTMNTDIKNGLYTDYHCLRPYDDYMMENEKIYNLLGNKNMVKFVI